MTSRPMPPSVAGRRRPGSALAGCTSAVRRRRPTAGADCDHRGCGRRRRPRGSSRSGTATSRERALAGRATRRDRPRPSDALGPDAYFDDGRPGEPSPAAIARRTVVDAPGRRRCTARTWPARARPTRSRQQRAAVQARTGLLRRRPTATDRPGAGPSTSSRRAHRRRRRWWSSASAATTSASVARRARCVRATFVTTVGRRRSCCSDDADRRRPVRADSVAGQGRGLVRAALSRVAGAMRQAGYADDDYRSWC